MTGIGTPCPSCGERWIRPKDHACGYVTLKDRLRLDRLRTLIEAERELQTLASTGAFTRTQGESPDA